MTLTEAAERLGVKRNVLVRLANTGKLHFVRGRGGPRGGARLVSRADLELVWHSMLAPSANHGEAR